MSKHRAIQSTLRAGALAVSLLAALSFGGDAFAAPSGGGGAHGGGSAKTEEASGKSDGGKKGGGKKGKGKKKDGGVQKTGIASIDQVMTRLEAVDDTLSSVETSLRSGKNNLNTALQLEKGTPLKDAIADLQRQAGNKLALVQKGKVPQLAVTDAVPANVQQAVDGLNGLLSDLTSSLDDLQALPSQVSALVNESKGLPMKLKDDFDGDLLATLFALPKATSALNSDLDLITGLPDRVTSVTSRTTEILSLVSSSFAPKR